MVVGHVHDAGDEAGQAAAEAIAFALESEPPPDSGEPFEYLPLVVG